MLPSVEVDSCPSRIDSSLPCHLGIHGFRYRSTGPKHPLQIMRCLTHGVFFTLYPIGYEPYARVRLVPVDGLGQPLAGTPEPEAADSAAAENRCDERWRSSRFEAVLDAADPAVGLWFPEGSERTPSQRTQRRWIARIQEILGLGASLSSALSEQIARVLGVPGYDHQQARSQVSSAGTLRERACAILHLVALMTLDDEIFARFLGAGSLSGFWKAGLIWDVRSSQIVFPVPGTSCPKSGRDPPG